MVLMDAPAHVGCLIEVRIIGIINAEQTEKGKTESNDRLLGVAVHSYDHEDLKTIEDVSKDPSGPGGGVFRFLQQATREEIQNHGNRRPEESHRVSEGRYQGPQGREEIRASAQNSAARTTQMSCAVRVSADFARTTSSYPERKYFSPGAPNTTVL
jgi:hypothetical protein